MMEQFDSMRVRAHFFLPFKDTHEKAPKRKNIALLALDDVFMALLESHIFQYDGAILYFGT